MVNKLFLDWVMNCLSTDLDARGATEAVALYDFTSRANKELSFKRGDALLLTSRVNQDWWEGLVDGKAGLVPHKFIAIHTRLAHNSVLGLYQIFLNSIDSVLTTVNSHLIF